MKVKSGVCQIEYFNAKLNGWEFQGTGFLYLKNNQIITNTYIIPTTSCNLHDYRAVFTTDNEEILFRGFDHYRLLKEGLIAGEIRNENLTETQFVVLCTLSMSAVDCHIFQPHLVEPCSPCAVLHYPSGGNMQVSEIVQYNLVPAADGNKHENETETEHEKEVYFNYASNPHVSKGSSGAPIVCIHGNLVGVNFTPGDQLPYAMLVNTMLYMQENQREQNHLRLEHYLQQHQQEGGRGI